MNKNNERWLLLVLSMASMQVYADPVSEITVPVVETKMTSVEMQQVLTHLQSGLNQKIERWGKSLEKKDFERNWLGQHQLNKEKRIEVCGIYQNLMNETYQWALKNKTRLNIADQKNLENRKQFIQSLGFKNNIVDTKMGFNCRLR